MIFQYSNFHLMIQDSTQWPQLRKLHMSTDKHILIVGIFLTTFISDVTLEQYSRDDTYFWNTYVLLKKLISTIMSIIKVQKMPKDIVYVEKCIRTACHWRKSKWMLLII